ncbi:venom allergen 5-like [Agrilus planipennis]|uniref:Venom allergen 5-like n=1 Tax=Agrilus planipennis TaxID=224129 RepID=A0A1W4WSB2_AGRPL|nr:venom allergen 5-like [Agrilus planipennis]
MKLIFLWILTIMLILPSFADENFYCYSQYFCLENEKGLQMHTMCKLEPCKFSKFCDETATPTPLSDVERKEVVKWHNDFRKYFANGELLNEIAVQPLKEKLNEKDYNPMTIEYDEELEFIAQCWANTCPTDEDPYCKKTNTYSFVEQNLFFVNHEDFLGMWQPVGMWFSTILSEKDNLTRYLKNAHKNSYARSFVNVIYPDTTGIGCGRTEWGRPERRVLAIVCNYGQAYRWGKGPVWRNYLQYAAALGNRSLAAYCGGNHQNEQEYGRLCYEINVKMASHPIEPPFQFTNDPYYWDRKSVQQRIEETRARFMALANCKQVSNVVLALSLILML